jgi:phosphatidylinositol glycan class K
MFVRLISAFVLLLVTIGAINGGAISGGGSSSANNNHWAVIVCTSRYWFNYRHLANALSVYWAARNAGIPDERIILMNSHPDASNDRRNSIRGTIVGADAYSSRHSPSSSGGGNELDELLLGVEFDYLGEDVNARTLTQVLTGRHSPHTTKNQMMLTNANSSIMIYLSGHGGDEFFKFHDNEEISASDFSQIFYEMHRKRRYGSILFVVETCQAATLGKYIDAGSPNVVTMASSQLGENSYSYTMNAELGVSVIDRFTYSFSKYLKDNNIGSRDQVKGTKHSLKKFLNSFDKRFLYSSVSMDISPNSSFTLNTMALDNFFSGARTFQGLHDEHISPQLEADGKYTEIVSVSVIDDFIKLKTRQKL